MLMADYYRQCPNCGGHTKDTTCEICGRTTMRTSETFEEVEHEHVAETAEVKKTSAGHIQAMMEEGRNFGKTKAEPISKRSKIVMVISILFVVLPLLIAVISDEESNNDNYYEDEYDAIYEQYEYLSDYLVDVQDQTPLTCELNTEDEESISVYNSTSYLYDADIALQTEHGEDVTYIYTGYPLGYTTDYVYGTVKECKVTSQHYQNLNLYNTDLIYDWNYDDKDHFILNIKEDTDQAEMETLLKRIYALNILTSTDYEGEEGHVYINDEYRYDMTFYYQAQTIEVIDIDSNDSWTIYLNLRF